MKKTLSLCFSLIILCTFCSCGTKQQPMVEQIQAICELSTVKAYYNNVAKSEKKSGSGWNDVIKQDRKFWIEYEGFVEVGIDMNKVSMKLKKDTVYVTLPEAELLNAGIVTKTFDDSCYKRNASAWWNQNKITTEDQQNAINEAQDEMRKSAENNRELFQRAECSSKNAIQNYFNKINKSFGSDYKIVWE